MCLSLCSAHLHSTRTKITTKKRNAPFFKIAASLLLVIQFQRHRPKSNASILKSLACRMQWGRAAASMEAVGALPGSKCDSAKSVTICSVFPTHADSIPRNAAANCPQPPRARHPCAPVPSVLYLRLKGALFTFGGFFSGSLFPCTGYVCQLPAVTTFEQ